VDSKTKKAIEKYGRENCVQAYASYQEGNGAGTIGCDLGLKTNQADAAINAGRKISESTKV